MYFLDGNWLIFTSKLATTVTGLRTGSDRPCCAKTEATRWKDQDTVSDKLLALVYDMYPSSFGGKCRKARLGMGQ